MPDLGSRLAKSEFKPRVLADQVSRMLMEAILDGTLKPGERLTETDLQAQLGISRSPLREAFRDLEKKGMVIIVPRKGTYVKEVTTQDIRENFPVRATLEGLAAREAHALITPEEIGQIAAALDGMKRAGETGDSELYRDNHFIFHKVFIKACGNELLIDTLRNLRMHRLWYYVSYQYHKEEIRKAISVHEKILNLISDKAADPTELESVVRNHIDEALEGFLKYISDHKEALPGVR